MGIAGAGPGAAAKWVLYALMALAAAGVILLIVFSNHYDWDAFYALAEVDYRSWWLDHQLPLWSYQLCAGISRIADPQAFGLSPFFVLILLFGSFWGVKLLVLSSLALGVFFTARLFELFHRHDSGQALDRRIYITLALLFVCGNFFMWHLLVGHVTFSVILLALGIAYLTLKGYLKGLSRWEFVGGTLLAWQHYSGGFYHSTVYFLLPFFVAFGIFALAEYARDRREPGALGRIAGKLRHAFGFNMAGIVLGGYKIWSTWSYSRGVGRRHEVVSEVLDPAQIGLHLLMPTWNRRFLAEFESGIFWDVHEYSALSLLVPLALAAGLWALAQRPRVKRFAELSSVGLFAGIYLCVAFAFSLGDFAMLSPYGFFNRLLFSEEARIIGRFHVGIVLALGLVLMVLLRAPSRSRWFGDIAGAFLLVGLIVNLSGFAVLASASQFEKILSYPADTSVQMRSWQRFKTFLPKAGKRGEELAPDATVNMYRYVLMGEGVLNCYNALPRKRARAPRARFVPLLNASATSPSPECRAKSQYTQNEIILDDACHDWVCVNAAQVNPFQGTPRLEVKRRFPGYCVKLSGRGPEFKPDPGEAGTQTFGN